MYIKLDTQVLLYLENNNSKKCQVKNFSGSTILPSTMNNILMFHLETQATLLAIPAALAKAHQVYGVKDSKVVFVVNEDGRNFADWCQVRMGGDWEEIGGC